MRELQEGIPTPIVLSDRKLTRYSDVLSAFRRRAHNAAIANIPDKTRLIYRSVSLVCVRLRLHACSIALEWCLYQGFRIFAYNPWIRLKSHNIPRVLLYLACL